MSDVLVGLLAIVIGLVFCFHGWLALRIIIPIWGAFAGFFLGAGLVAAATDEEVLGSVLGWVVALGLALAFGLIAYLYYAVAIVVAMAAIGFTLGTDVTVALGVTWSWVIILVGIAVAVLLALVAVLGNLPLVVLVVLSALAGASTIVGGIMLTFGVIVLGDLSLASTTDSIDDDWWWYAAYVVLAIAGIVVQLRGLDRWSASVRDEWVNPQPVSSA